MYRYIYAIVFLFFVPFTLLAQQEQCATMDIWQQQVQANPQLKVQMDRLEQAIQHRLSQRSARDSTVITIPVVFHIVHNGEPVGTGPNISDAQVISQLNVLNEDFRRTNPDTGNTPAIFKPVAADTRIQFCLATQAPDGSVATGINRINGGQASWSNSAIQNTLKPNTVWDADKYLNFWVVNFSSSTLLGYAQFPGGNKQTDGVVVGYRYVGRAPDNPFNNNYNLGRTGTHEVGHWLNLRHIWGDGPCSQDDFVHDTPLADGSNSACPTVNSCVDTPVNHPDMVQNYMDYTYDNCMNIFTQGQADRMRAAIQLDRPGLLQAASLCTPLPTFTYNGRVVDSLTGQGIEGATVFLDGFFNYTVTTDSGGYFSLPNFYGDTYRYYAGKWGYQTMGVPVAQFDSTSAPLLIKLMPGYYDDFVLDFGWTATATASTGLWERNVPIGTNFNGLLTNPGVDVNIDLGEACFMTGNGGGNAGTDDVDDGAVELTSPWFDGTTMSDPMLSFYRWFVNAGGSGTPNDTVQFVIDNGQTTATLLQLDQSDPSQSQWVFESFRLSNYLPVTDSMRLIVTTADQAFTGHLVEVAIDVFKVADSLTQFQPPIAAFNTSNDTVCQGATVQFFNDSKNGATSFVWNFEGGSPATSTAVNPVIRYDSVGTFDVQLKAINNGGEDSILSQDIITVVPQPQATVSAIDITCFGANDGQAVVQVNQGVPPYTYLWNNGATGDTIDSLSTGFYFVTITGGNGCFTDGFAQVDQPVQLSINGASTPDTNATGKGTARATVGGGTKPYTYRWDDPLTQTTRVADSLLPGDYTVMVTDANGCLDQETVTVDNVTTTAIDAPSWSVTIHPNPARSLVHISLDQYVQDLHLQVVNFLGQEMGAPVNLHNSGTWTLDVSAWPQGMYWVVLSQGDRQMAQSFMISR